MKRKTNDWMPLYIGDYLRDTGHLSAAEHGSYLLLIMACWAGGGAISGEDRVLRQIARMTAQQWRDSRCTLIAFFRRGEDNQLVHSRVATELARSRRLTETRRAAGKKGGRPPTDPEKQLRKQNETPTGRATTLPSEVPTPPELPKNPPSEVKKDASPPAQPDPRGTRLSEDWVLTTELTAYATEHGFTEGQAWAMAEDFVLYWQAKAGAGARHTDWNKTWMSWVRREEQRRGQNRSRASDAHAGRLSNLERALRTPARRAGFG